MIRAVIGKNFGDEGKGLAVDYFCGRVPHCLVVKHNGGAQAGHTVTFDSKRFVFHQLSSGSFRGADTYFATTYYPDFYKIGEEMAEFYEMAHFIPKIICNVKTPLIYIDDIIINMALEESRGKNRHGSCGMGINEGDLRSKAGFMITAGDLFGKSASEFAKKLSEIREEYGKKRFRELGLSSGSPEYEEMLCSKEILYNASEEMMRNAEQISFAEEENAILQSAPEIVFETGQGLLLDCDNMYFQPHVTASKTGLANITALLEKADLSLSEVCYVSRTYVTRHGAGELPYETKPEALEGVEADLTNVENPWQGRIRYATHGTLAEFITPVKEDLKYLNNRKGENQSGNQSENQSGNQTNNPTVSLFLTHLNETQSQILLTDQRIAMDEFINYPEIKQLFTKIYLSGSVNGDETKAL